MTRTAVESGIQRFHMIIFILSHVGLESIIQEEKPKN